MIALMIASLALVIVQTAVAFTAIVGIDHYTSAAHGFSSLQGAVNGLPYLVSAGAVVCGIWSKLILEELSRKSSADMGWGDVLRVSRHPTKIIPSILLCPLIIGPLFKSISVDGDLLAIAIFSYQNGFFIQYVTSFSRRTA